MRMREHHLAWGVVGCFLGVFIWLMVAVANAPVFLAQPVWRGVNVGHCLVLVLHVLAVVVAWAYIFMGEPPGAEPGADAEEARP